MKKNISKNREPSQLLQEYCAKFGYSADMVLSKSRDTVTAEIRKKIAVAMALDGVNRAEIAVHLNIGSSTLYNYFPVDKNSDQENKPQITLDFTYHLTIYQKICEAAASRLRSPVNQVMWWLINSDFDKLNKRIAGE